MALPLGLMEIFIGIYYRIDTVLLSFITTDAIVGWYDAAYTFVHGLRLLPVTVAMVLLPGLTNIYSKNREKAAGIYRNTMYYSIATGVWITFLIAANSSFLVSLVFGKGYGTLFGCSSPSDLDMRDYVCKRFSGNSSCCYSTEICFPSRNFSRRCFKSDFESDSDSALEHEGCSDRNSRI